MINTIIFDLDGTLIDSQESILSAIRNSMQELNLEPKIPITRELIGPPLNEVLKKILDAADHKVLNELASRFKSYYDMFACKDCLIYPGIQKLLERLYDAGFTLCIATNKRSIPTEKILDHLAWGPLFSAVYGIDSDAQKPFKNKTEMISVLLKDMALDSNSVIYIGDRVEDYEAAKLNSLQCILVDWGYAESLSNLEANTVIVRSAAELLKALKG